MTGFIYYDFDYNPDKDKSARYKFLIVTNENRERIYTFNLTEMGLEHIDSYEEFEKMFPAPYYDYNSGTLKDK